MENQLVRRFPRLFPSSLTSSCQNAPNIAETSILLTKTSIQNQPSSRIPQNTKSTKNDAENKRDHQKNTKNCSSSNSGCFSSETDTFCSFSTTSGSAESFRLMKMADGIGNSKRLGIVERCPSDVSLPVMKMAEKSKNLETGRSLSEVSVRSIGSILTDLNQNTAKTTQKQENQNRAKSNDESDKENQLNQEIPGLPAELYYSKNNPNSRRKRPTKSSSRRRNRKMRQSRIRAETDENGLCSLVVGGRIEDSYAVEKSSSDPYSDFRKSMVEMIVEKQIFGAEDLERLLDCFLSLNSPCYYRVIVEVYDEICQTLFAD